MEQQEKKIRAVNNIALGGNLIVPAFQANQPLHGTERHKIVNPIKRDTAYELLDVLLMQEFLDKI